MNLEDYSTGVLIAVAFAIGILSGAIIFSLLGQPVIVQTEEVIVSTQEVDLTVIEEGIGLLIGIRVNESLCGVNQPIRGSDGNVAVQQNTVPPGLVYSCFAPAQGG